MSEKDYVPFGEEWKAELKKCTKDMLIDIIRDSLIKIERMESLTTQEIEEAITTLSKESTAPDCETPHWMQADIHRGMKWMYVRLTGKILG